MKTTDSDQPNQDAMGELRDEVATLLSGDYGCTRVWTAWQYGTMTQDDFVPLEDTERVDEIVALAEAYAQRRVEEKLKEYQDYLLDDAAAMIPNAYIRRAYAYFVRDQLNQTTEDKT